MAGVSSETSGRPPSRPPAGRRVWIKAVAGAPPPRIRRRRPERRPRSDSPSSSSSSTSSSASSSTGAAGARNAPPLSLSASSVSPNTSGGAETVPATAQLRALQNWSARVCADRRSRCGDSCSISATVSCSALVAVARSCRRSGTTRATLDRYARSTCCSRKPRSAATPRRWPSAAEASPPRRDRMSEVSAEDARTVAARNSSSPPYATSPKDSSASSSQAAASAPRTGSSASNES
mmetsp:Transcript_30100/g.101478  ORF Transcript_30100/g.101478 Transcript_30100/m.101478 type:complete len:236 (-) Transcript_30100:905-1612(-)